MSIPQLARLQTVSLREAWPHEAGSFTPWLARCENLQLLGDSIDMTLECEAQEHAVGDFSADIVCRDLHTDRYVRIENQIERTRDAAVRNRSVWRNQDQWLHERPMKFEHEFRLRVADLVLESRTEIRQNCIMFEMNTISLDHLASSNLF